MKSTRNPKASWEADSTFDMYRSKWSVLCWGRQTRTGSTETVRSVSCQWKSLLFPLQPSTISSMVYLRVRPSPTWTLNFLIAFPV